MTESVARPPSHRTPAWSALETHAREGMLVLPRCRTCDTVQYPPRELCRKCLGDALEWVETDPAGMLLSWTMLHASLSPFFRAHLPWTLGLVQLAGGPVLVTHLFAPEPASGMAVETTLHRDLSGRMVLVSRAPGHELGRDPRARALLELEP